MFAVKNKLSQKNKELLGEHDDDELLFSKGGREDFVDETDELDAATSIHSGNSQLSLNTTLQQQKNE